LDLVEPVLEVPVREDEVVPVDVSWPVVVFLPCLLLDKEGEVLFDLRDGDFEPDFVGDIMVYFL
jgi:hypothetical protein